MSTDMPDEPISGMDSPTARSPNQETTTSSSSLVAEPPCALVPSSSTQFLDSMALPQSIDKTTIKELLINLHGFLNSTGLSNVADVLKHELESKGLIPQRYAFDGRPRSRTFDSFMQEFKPYQTNFLQILSRLNERTNLSIPPSISNINVRLFSGPRNSLIRKKLIEKKSFTLNSRVSHAHVKTLETCKNTNVLMARELGMQISPRLLQRKQAFANINDHGKLHGHILPVFCVTFDQTGRYVLTGGDDKLIKVWDTVYGRLRYTFRGHTGEISDLTINAENNCLASGSNDKTVRVWNTGNGQPLKVFRKHTGLVTMVRFTDYIDGDVRYLVSTANDCTVIFYRYMLSSLSEPIRYEEREIPNAHGLVLNTSFGGNFVVMGDSANMIHIYKLSPTNVDRIAEFNAHDEWVDSLVFANSHLRFASGSKDGIAKVWEFESGEWKSTELRVQDQPQAPPPQQTNRKNNAYKLTMLGWSGNDQKIVTTGSDHLVRVWDWKSGQMIRKMEGHTGEVFVIKTHPIHDDLMFTAGHDGVLMLWDISTYQNVWQQKNQLDLHSAAVAIFDLAISPQGDRYAYVDINGMLTLLGIGENRTASNSQIQQFFSTDYDEMFFDDNGFVQDIEGIAGHLALPSLLVNVDMHPYGPDIQRLVPGRDFANPNIVKNPWTDRKILPAIPLQEQFAIRIEKSQMELAEYEAGKPLDDAEIERRRLLEEERRRQAYLKKLENKRNRNRNRQQSEERMRQLMRPRYIIDETFTDNDTSYSEGSDISSLDGTGAESNLSHDEVEEDDSDYEVGREERETVFRTRSAVTVTGRRKKNFRVRRNTEETSQQLDDQQPSTSQVVVVQKTTRYGRKSKPPPRMENEFEQGGRRRTRATAVNSEPEPSFVHHNTRQRARRLKIDDSDEESRSPQNLPDQDLGTSSQSTNKRRGRYQQEVSSSDQGTSPAATSPDLDALDDEMEHGFSASTTPEGSISQSSHQSEEELNKDGSEKPSKRKLTNRKQMRSSRSAESDNSSDSENESKLKNELRTTKSGRKLTIPKMLIKEDFSGTNNRRRRVVSPQRRSARQARQSYHFNYDEAENSDEYQRESQRSSRRQLSKKRYNEMSASDQSLSPVAGPSNFVQPQRSQRLSSRIQDDGIAVYPDWITNSQRLRFPYVAQLGDKVVYFVQGHRNYIQASNIHVAHQYEKDMETYDAAEFFIVTNIKYTDKNKSNTLVQSVELSHLINGKPDGKKFKFCFHDQKDCPDFLILKQHYDRSLAYNFKPNDRVEMVLTDYVYTGSIKSHQCTDPMFPSSEWNAVHAEWDDGNNDECSIWDIQPQRPHRSKTEQCKPEDSEEFGKYDPEPNDWPQLNDNESPSAARTRYTDRCLKAINELVQIESLNPFVEMIDLSLYPAYYELIKRPVFLQLIIDRIRKFYYRSLASLKFDIQQIAKNAHTFNEPGSEIIYLSNLLVTTLFDMLDDFEIESAQSHFTHLDKSDTAFHSRHNEDLIPKSLSHINVSNPTISTTDSWQKQCQALLNEFIRINLVNQPAKLRDEIAQIGKRAKDDAEICTPNDLKDAIKEALDQGRTDLSRKERRYGELVNLANVLENQFKSIISQYQRTQQVRKTRNQQSAYKKETYNLRTLPEKRVLRARGSQPHYYDEDDEPSTSKRRRLR